MSNFIYKNTKYDIDISGMLYCISYGNFDTSVNISKSDYDGITIGIQNSKEIKPLQYDNNLKLRAIELDDTFVIKFGYTDDGSILIRDSNGCTITVTPSFKVIHIELDDVGFSMHV